MKATIVDLRYRMKDVLNALKRRERVTILQNGKHRGTIIPAADASTGIKVTDHAFFGSGKNTDESVAETMKNLRGGRYNDI